MIRRAFTIIVGAATALTASAVIVNLATGAKMFTRFEDSAIIESNQQSSLGDLFGETGLDEHHGELKSVESGFALGWLPSGPGLASASVTTIAAPAAAIAIGAWWLQRRTRRRADAPAPASAPPPLDAHLERTNGHAHT